MYLLYVDESGRSKGGTSRHFVVAGLAIHEEDCYPFSRSLDAVQRRVVGAAYADLELHASDLWAARSAWARVPEADRHRLVRSVVRHIANWTSRSSGRPITLFASVVHKPSYPVTTAERAHEELFARFDEFVGRLHRQGDSHRSLVIADDSSFETTVQSLAPSWKRGARTGPLHSLVEVPLYADSRVSRLIQAADFVAWSVFQYYENGHAEHLQQLHRRFDSDDGVQHGLVHIRRGYRHCPCVPCTSRRTHVIEATLTAVPMRI